MAEDGWHTEGIPEPVIIAAEVVGTDGDLPVSEARFVTVRRTQAPRDFQDARMIGPNGEVMFEIESTTEGEVSVADWTLVRTEAGWRVVQITAM